MFYPALLKKGSAGDPEDETVDAIEDHNKIRDAVAEARKHPVGTTAWFEAVATALKENGEHLDEDEREAKPDFIKSASLDMRHELAMKWLRFYHDHPDGKGVDDSDKDPDAYLADNS